MNDKQWIDDYLDDRFLELQEFIVKGLRPANEVIKTDEELIKMLHVSKRTLLTWRETGVLVYSKLGGKIFYRLSDVLNAIEKHKITASKPKLRIGGFRNTSG